MQQLSCCPFIAKPKFSSARKRSLEPGSSFPSIIHHAFKNNGYLTSMLNATGGPPKKKQKTEKRIAMDGPNVGLSRLTKHQIDFTPELSPGALHSNRVAIQVSTNHLNLLGPSCTCSHLGCLHLGKTQSYYSLPFQILSFYQQFLQFYRKMKEFIKNSFNFNEK